MTRLLEKPISIYRLRKMTLLRDNNQCVICGAKEKLEVDHIKPFAIYREHRYDLNNLQTLCGPCHRKTDTYGGKTQKKKNEIEREKNARSEH